jgi:hypothetical protein
MVNGVQDICSMLGKYGCLIFSLIKYCEVVHGYNGGVIETVQKIIDNNLIVFNKDKPNAFENGYVLSSVGIIKLLTGKTVKESREDIAGYCKEAENNAINFWQLENAKMGDGHFTFGDWDSFYKSNTKTNGYLKQIRRFTVCN